MFSLSVMGFSVSEVHPTLRFRSFNYGLKFSYLFILIIHLRQFFLKLFPMEILLICFCSQKNGASLFPHKSSCSNKDRDFCLCVLKHFGLSFRIDKRVDLY